ncbi:hypothetical protein ACNZ64_002495, partial [Enterococcus hirae]
TCAPVLAGSPDFESGALPLCQPSIPIIFKLFLVKSQAYFPVEIKNRHIYFMRRQKNTRIIFCSFLNSAQCEVRKSIGMNLVLSHFISRSN